MKGTKKAGFTLIELMVVTIIVAILAAVAIPLMNGNKDRAIATEGQAGIGAIVTAAALYYTDNSEMPSSVNDLHNKYLKEGDLAGKYNFAYTFSTALSYDDTTGMAGGITATADEGTVILTIGTREWSGTLLGADATTTP